MRALLSALLLSSLLQLCGAAALSCSRFHNLTASDLAVQHINQHHRHGYKFSLDDVSEAQLERVAGGVASSCSAPEGDDVSRGRPQRAPGVRSRMMGERAVVANCSVLITVKDDNATVSRYDCQTRQEMTNREMMRMCPDCPTLLPLDDPKGLEAVQEAIFLFAVNSSLQRTQMARVLVRRSPRVPHIYHTVLLVLLTLTGPLPTLTGPLLMLRDPLPTLTGPLLMLRDPLPTLTGPPTDAQRPPPHAHGPPTDAQRPPPHAHGPPTDAQRPPPHAHGPPTDAQRPPPHAHGPPTDAQRPPPRFPRPSHCPGPLAAADPAVHPICPWPRPARPQPRGD
uniref:Cystatin domain-containing protein n=1 Tax=Tetraodon nigroviridis TaxID=99883 RepID=H3C5X1_TETNG